MTERILIVDDEENMRWVLKEALSEAGYEVAVAAGGQEALSRMADQPADLILLDLKLKGMDGLVTLRKLRERWPEVVVVILTAYGTVASAVEAMQLGAADYLRKPFDVEEIRFKIERALERKALQSELHRLRLLSRTSSDRELAGSHPAWRECLDQVRSLAMLDLSIALLGEPGAGKLALARLAHAISQRSEAPLVVLDARTVPEHVQQEIIGGGTGDEGLWARAGSGSLLIRHAEALRAPGWTVLGDRLRRRHGVGPRLLLTAERLDEQILAQFPLTIVRVPPLRERATDIALLALAFAEQRQVTPAALTLLEAYAWPGNLAELHSVLERALALAQDQPLDVMHLPEHITQAPAAATPLRLPAEGLSLESVEIALLRQALERAGGNKTRAAELLGLTRHTLLYRLEKYGITSDRD